MPETNFVLRFPQKDMEIFNKTKFIFCLHEDIAYWLVSLSQYSLTALDCEILMV